MATSAPNPLEEHITCSVCLEIYTNPQALKCLHTFCYQCVQGLKERNRVQCPQCREYTNVGDIKQNFTVQSFIDVINTSTKSPTTKSSSEIVCDVCESGKFVHSFCTNCQEHLCADCAKAHRGSKASKCHKLMAFNELSRSKQDKVDEQINVLRDGHTDVDKKLSSNRELINNIHHAVVRQISEINRYRKTIKQQVDDHHDGLIEELQTINKFVVETLEQQGQLLTQAKQHINDKVNFLSDISQSHDYSVLTDTLKNLSEEIQQALEQIPKVDVHTQSPVTVVKGEGWDPLKSTKLEVASTALVTRGHGISQPTKQHRKKAIHQRYRQLKCVDIEYMPNKLCVYTDELWVGAGDKGVFVYDLDLQFIKHIMHSQFTYVTSVIKKPTYIIVCDRESGLHCLNQQGDYLQRISKGSYSDVGFHNNQLYALNYNQDEIYLFSRTQVNWLKDTNLRLSHYSKGSSDDKLCITSTGIYISCWSTHCVQCYSHTGQFVYQTGKSGRDGGVGEFRGPFLSDVDSESRVLVCDSNNQRLQVLYADTGEWREITLLEGVKRPRCAGVGDRYLWVGTLLPCKLLKYEVKGDKTPKFTEL